MAGAIFTAATTAEVALVATSQKVLVRLISTTNSAVKIKEWGVYFDGVSVTAEPCVVQLCCVNTSYGYYTSHTPARRSGPAISARSIVQTANASSQPDILTVIATREVHPQSGYQEKFSYGDEIILSNGSTATNGAVAIIVNAPTSVDAFAEMVFEE
jgi:hypothetical protein